MAQVLIFGGSFSPPTLAHEAMLAAFLELPHFNSVWLLLSGERTDKHMSASDVHRIRMLEIAKATTFKDDPRVLISDFELKLSMPSQLRQTNKALIKEYPDTAFWFAFGGDAYRDMPEWENGEKLQQSLRMVIVADELPEGFDKSRMIYMRTPSGFSEVSSSKIRGEIAAGKRPTGSINPVVLSYIEEQGLYKK